MDFVLPEFGTKGSYLLIAIFNDLLIPKYDF